MRDTRELGAAGWRRRGWRMGRVSRCWVGAGAGAGADLLGVKNNRVS